MPDGDGSLLDHSLLVYGSPLSDGNMHLCEISPCFSWPAAQPELRAIVT